MMRSPRSWPTSSAGRARGAHPARVEHHDLVGQLGGLLGAVGGEQDRRALVAQLADQVAHRDAGLRVQPGGRLVEQEDLRAADQRGGQGQALALAAGQPPDRSAQQRAEPESLDELAAVPAAGRASRRRGASTWPAGAASGRPPSWSITPTRVRRAGSSGARPSTSIRPSVGVRRPDDALDEGRLAGAVGAEQRGQPAARAR